MELQEKLDKVEKEYGEGIARLQEKSDKQRTELVSSAVSAQRNLFDNIVNDYAQVRSDKELQEAYDYFRAVGQEGIDKLPRRVQTLMKKELDAIPDSVKKGEQAVSYVFVDGKNSEFVLPFTKHKSESGLTSLVYTAVKANAENYSKAAKENAYNGNCIGFTVKLKENEDLDKLIEKMQTIISDKANGILKFQVVRMGNFEKYVGTVPSEAKVYTNTDFFKLYSCTYGPLYKALDACKIGKIYTKGARGQNVRIFDENDKEKLDQYFAGMKRRNKKSKDSKDNKEKKKRIKWLKTTKVAKELELGTERVRQIADKGGFGNTKRKGRLIMISSEGLEKFKKEHVRMNMIYRTKK